VSVDLGIEHGKRMRRMLFSPLACLPYFSTLSHKRHGFWEKKLLNTKCMFRYYLLLLAEIFNQSKKNSVTY